MFKSFQVKVMCFFIIAMIFILALSNFVIYEYALKSQIKQLRDKLMTVANIASASIDASTLAAIPLDKEGVNSPAYQEINSKLRRIKYAAGAVKYVYILVKTDKPGILKFVADLNLDNSGPQTYPGLEYNAERFPEMLEGFEGPSADKVLTGDEWGVFLSGYAPVRDAAGKPVAVLGVDMQARDVHTVQKQVRMRAFYLLLLGIIMAFLFGAIVSSGVAKQVKELSYGVKRIAKGELDFKIKVRGSDEIARLAEVFNKMTQDLKAYIADLKRTTAEKERLLKELEIAQRIQKSFLPESSPKISGLDIAAINIPARMVSGDFYDFIPIEENKWGLVIADVSGKGVPAALFMALSRTLLRASVSVISSPSDTLVRANELIMRDSKSDLFVTLFYAVVDANTLTFRYANAGHNPPIFVKDGSSDIIFLKTHGAPLGICSDISVTTDEFSLKKNDLLVLYTDGVIDAVNDKNEHFDMERLSAIVASCRSLSAQDTMDRIQEEVSNFVGGQPQYDDITLMIIKAV